jgi:flagellar M-ring protein FliF
MPRPTSRPANGPAGASRRTESVSYQPSKTVRHVRTPQGVVKKVSVALLIDHTVRWESKDKKPVRTLVPPSPEMLKTIRDVTSATVGLNVERGDQVVVESLPFESTLSAEPPPGMEPQSVPAQPQNPLGVNIGDPRTLLIGGAAAVLLLAVIGFGVFRVLRRKQRRPAAVTVASEVGPGSDPKRIADGHADDMRQQLTDHADEKRQMIAEAQQKLKLQPVQTQKSEVLVGYLREAVKNDPQAAASVIRTWLHED